MLTDQQIDAELQAAGIDMQPANRRLREMLDAHRPPESLPRCEIRCGDFPRIGAENGHFVVHADEHSTIVEDDLGPLDKARAQFWLAELQARQSQGV